ncbi:MAG TPA: hypothetical protein VF614_18265, partial [Chthoniobacteraceae bacterium]
RFVVYRSLEEIPKIRLVDLESADSPRTVSFPFGGGRSFRNADSAAITPEGRFVSFSYRETPFLSGNDPQLCVNDTTAANRISGSAAITSDFVLETLGRGAMTRDGNTFIFETSDSLVAADTNTEQDIYLLERGSTPVLISKSGAGSSEEGAARDPVVTADGQTIFFISDRKLVTSDNDEGATIYRSSASDSFATPVPIDTEVHPLRMSLQGTANGDYIVFLGRPARGAARPYLLRVSDGQLYPLAPSATEAPALSADNGYIAFTSAARLDRKDSNRATDIYIEPNPVEDARLPEVTVTLSQPADGTIVSEGQGMNLAATSSAGAIGIRYTAIEVDGREFTRSFSGSLQNNDVALPLGVHTIRAVAYSEANVASYSAAVTVTVRPAANQVRLTDILDLQSAAQQDGAVRFTGVARIDNTFATTRGPLQLVLTEAPAAARWETFGDETLAPVREEQVLQVLDVPILTGQGVRELGFESITSAPEVVGENSFQGLGWIVTARLREQVSGSWVDRDAVTVLEVRPRLSEDTPGPNGGIPVLGDPQDDGTFNPAILEAVQVAGRRTIGELTSTTYKAAAIFNTGSKPCTPTWELINAGSSAAITSSGVLTTSAVPSPKKIGVKATFGGRTQTLNVTIQPKTPVVSVVASVKVAPEAGEGEFRILRSGTGSEALEVDYEISGPATPDGDYTALSGTATIPAGASAVPLTVTSLDDGAFEGLETVQLRLLDSSSYRIGKSRTATVTIEDDEPVPTGQPDLVLQGKKKQTIGAQIFHFDSALQQLEAAGKKDKVSVFTAVFVNRTGVAQDLDIVGGGDFLGFAVRYFDSVSEITAAVVAGDYKVTDLAAGEAASIQVEITPTAATPLGTTIRCPIAANSNGFKDTGEIVLKRVR